MDRSDSQDASRVSENSIQSMSSYRLNQSEIAQEEEVNYSQEFFDDPHTFGLFADDWGFDSNDNDNVAMINASPPNIQPHSAVLSSFDDPYLQCHYHQPQQMFEEQPAQSFGPSILPGAWEQNTQLYGGPRGGVASLPTLNRPLGSPDLISPPQFRPNSSANSRHDSGQHGGMGGPNDQAQAASIMRGPPLSNPLPLTSYSSFPPAYRTEPQHQMGYIYTPGAGRPRMAQDEAGYAVPPRPRMDRDEDGYPGLPGLFDMAYNTGFNTGHQSMNMPSMMHSHNHPMAGGYTEYTNHAGEFNGNSSFDWTLPATNMQSFDNSTQMGAAGYHNHYEGLNENEGFNESAASQSTTPAPNMTSINYPIQGSSTGGPNTIGEANGLASSRLSNSSSTTQPTNTEGQEGSSPYLHPALRHYIRRENSNQELTWRPHFRAVRMTESELEETREGYSRDQRPNKSTFNREESSKDGGHVLNPAGSPLRAVRIDYEQEDTLSRRRVERNGVQPPMYRHRDRPPKDAIFMIRTRDADGNAGPWSYTDPPDSLPSDWHGLIGNSAVTGAGLGVQKNDVDIVIVESVK